MTVEHSASRVEKKLIRSDRVREICGGISNATLTRWIASDSTKGADDIPFPKPIKLGFINFWGEEDILAFVYGRPKTTEPNSKAGKAA